MSSSDPLRVVKPYSPLNPKSEPVAKIGCDIVTKDRAKLGKIVAVRERHVFEVDINGDPDDKMFLFRLEFTVVKGVDE